MTKIRVGITGVASTRGWAARAHIPALRALAGYDVVALCTRRRESAEAAARAFHVAKAYDDYRALIEDPEIDLVVVNVKIQAHYPLVEAAILAGKMVFCEWSLGRTLAETRVLAELARQHGVRTVIGLQGRSSPHLNHVRNLITEGFVGEVLSTSLIGGGVAGDFIEQGNAYILQAANGAAMLNLPFGHTIDAVCWCLGEFRSLSALSCRQRTRTTIRETGVPVAVETDDQLVVAGILQSGAVIACHYRSEYTPGTRLLWEINGTRGVLQIRGDSGHAQIGSLTIHGAQHAPGIANPGIDRLRSAYGGGPELAPLPVPESCFRGLAPIDLFADNVAQAYAQFARDLAEGTRVVPDFDDALHRHLLIDAVAAAARSGGRVDLPV